MKRLENACLITVKNGKHTGKKLMVPKLCSACQALFDKANMPRSVLMAGTEIFNEGVETNPWKMLL